MSFSYSVQINDPAHRSQDAALKADVEAALGEWSNFLIGQGSMEVQVNIVSTTSGRASGRSETSFLVGTDGARSVFEQGAAHELITGSDPNGSSADIIIEVDPNYLVDELWLDPDPGHPSNIPANRTDAVSVFRHELMHAFAMNGWRDPATGALPATFESTWDKLVQLHANGSAFFVGAAAEAVYGGEVPVTTLNNGQQFNHLGNSVTDPIVGQDLMNGVVFFRGQSYQISTLDLAILRDLGLAIVPPLPLTSVPYDFNGDGKSDLLWQHTSGLPAIWFMNGTTEAGSANLRSSGPTWHAVSAADFNSDGKADILWQNDNGTPALWFMNGTTELGGANLRNPGSTWHAVAAADFNGDGKADILWQNDNGTPAIWFMNGTTELGGANLRNPGPAWHAVAAADFNGDGKADVLWQNDNGTPAIWFMNGTTELGGANLRNPGPGWHAVAAAEYNSDGKADIVWQNDNGLPAIWFMNGTTELGGVNLRSSGPDWHLT
jgi:hypothetical protein